MSRRLSLFFYYSSVVSRVLHSFPTRRSSDLDLPHRVFVDQGPDIGAFLPAVAKLESLCPVLEHAEKLVVRSEEHTSELQSLRQLVCRLLLEKKKNKQKNKKNTNKKTATTHIS